MSSKKSIIHSDQSPTLFSMAVLLEMSRRGQSNTIIKQEIEKEPGVVQCSSSVLDGDIQVRINYKGKK